MGRRKEERECVCVCVGARVRARARVRESEREREKRARESEREREENWGGGRVTANRRKKYCIYVGPGAARVHAQQRRTKSSTRPRGIGYHCRSFALKNKN